MAAINSGYNMRGLHRFLRSRLSCPASYPCRRYNTHMVFDTMRFSHDLETRIRNALEPMYPKFVETNSRFARQIMREGAGYTVMNRASGQWLESVQVETTRRPGNRLFSAGPPEIAGLRQLPRTSGDKE